MSTIKANAILDASGGNTVTINSVTPTAYNTMGKNRIINGDMRIDQRNAGASVALSGTGQYIVDRWKCRLDASSSSTGQQVSDAPSGFNNSIKITIGTGASPSSSQIGWLSQFTEGLYISDFGFGTADAKTVTLSFWVKSSVTGVFSGVIKNQNTSAYPFEYTVSSANTWEQKSVTILGDTGNTWGTDNSFGIGVFFDLGTGTTYQAADGSWASGNYFSATGSTSLCATSGATFYITGVQLEVGSVATEFERRPYGMELALCQRYFWQIGTGEAIYTPIGTGPSENTFSNTMVKYPVKMRAVPTFSFSGLQCFDGSSTVTATSVRSFYGGLQTANIQLFHSSTVTGRSVICSLTGTSSYAAFNAEL